MSYHLLQMSYLYDIIMNSHNEQFGSIYEQYVEKIYRFVYLKVSSQEIAEDISSKVFLKGWEVYQNQDKSISNIGAFLYQIARNMVTDHYREKGKVKLVSTDHLAYIVDNKVNIHEKAVFNADLEKVKKAIQNLKKDYQDVLILHYLEDMPVPKVADILQKNPATIRVMVHRGLKALRGKLQEEV